MQFELSEALIDHILFSMEDQEGVFCLDSLEGLVVKAPEEHEPGSGQGDRYLPLPQWMPADGFRLMERFAASLKNPLVRQELSSSLDQGRGVFRAFKNTLGQYPEIEKLWFQFKDREMKAQILRWYNALREEWGLEKIGTEPDETEDLVLEDFRFRPVQKNDLANIAALHRYCQEEHQRILVEGGAGNASKLLTQEWGAEGGESFSLCAESSGGDLAGYIRGQILGGVLLIEHLEVGAEYRGLGIGETLLQKFLASFSPGDYSQALIDLPSWAEGFSRVLLRESFQPYMVRYRLDPHDRED
ncbi:MAG: UPF0158 family protein [Treponema sp.]|nr:UPF0158 family protein [Treponema sp.]